MKTLHELLERMRSMTPTEARGYIRARPDEVVAVLQGEAESYPGVPQPHEYAERMSGRPVSLWARREEE